MREERRSRSRINGATHAFDDEPTLTSAELNTVTLEFKEELVGIQACLWCQRMVDNTVSGYTVSGSMVTLMLGTDVQPGDEAGGYQSSTATLKDVDEGEDGLDHGFNGGDPCV